LLVKLYGPEHITVIGYGYGGHFIFPRPLDQRFNANGPVEEAVLCVQVQMNEFRRYHDKFPYFSSG
jgi:hypothetical protein